MKKLILLLLASFFCLTSSRAQTSAKIRDSLKVLLQKGKQDTNRVRLLDELAFSYYESKPDTAMLLELEALSLSRRIGYIKGEAVSLSRMGTIYIVLGNTTKSMELFVQAQKLNEKINSHSGIAESLNNIGGIYKNQGQFQEAIGYYLKAKKIIDKLNLKKEIARSLNNGIRLSSNWLNSNKQEKHGYNKVFHRLKFMTVASLYIQHLSGQFNIFLK